MAKDMDSGEIVVSSIRVGMKREFEMMMKAQSEIGVLSVGQRRVTRSQSTAGCSKDTVESSDKIGKKAKGSDAKRSKEDAEEKLGRDDTQKLDSIDVFAQKLENFEILDNEKAAESDLVEVVVNEEEELKILENRPVVEEKKSDAEITVAGLNEVVKQPTCTESPLPQVGVNEIESGCEEDKTVGGASELGRERTGGTLGGLPEKQTRSFTRSAFKLQIEPTESGSMAGESWAGAVKSDGSMTLTSSPLKLEMKMSKKVELKKIPTKLKDLLNTGLLEGLPVHYIHRSKVKGRPKSGLRGTVRGSGILCSCGECNGEKVVTPNQFELHAGSANKRPPEYIYLDNGKPLSDILKTCKSTPSDALELTIQNAIGSTESKVKTFCLNCKGSIPLSGIGRSMLLCDSCVCSKEPEPRPKGSTYTAHRSPLSASTIPSASMLSSNQTQISSQGSAQLSSSIHPRIKGQGRLTRKDLRMHKLVFQEDVLPERTALAYFVRGQKRLEGYKEGSGIFCFCCNTLCSPSQFESHAGFASRRKPYMNIFTSNGVSLHELSLRLSKERKVSSDENDDLCSICADGGDLLCCDTCPRAFHSECVALPSIPKGSWYCKYCENMFLKEKFAERNANAIAAGRVAGIDALGQITQRCIRIIETSEAEVGGCAICGGDDFNAYGFDDTTVIICDQCEKDYHVGCLREQKMDDLKELPKYKWFCCTQCTSIHSSLQNLVMDGEQMLPETLINHVKKKHKEKGAEVNPEFDVRWRLLNGRLGSEDTRAWLSGAVNIFHEQFDPISDSSTSRIDLIPNMVFGRQLKDQDFGGMYCAILTVNSVVVSTVIVRIFGQEVAELPLVATRTDCQAKGYFHCLFVCIENLLADLNVKNLVLPAADEAEPLWKNKYGFVNLNQKQLDEYKKEYQFMIFQGTTVLHKSVSKS